MSRQRKGRLPILTVAVLLVSLLFAGFSTLSSKEALAAAPNDGSFHLTKYIDAGESKEPTGQKEDPTDPANVLYGKEVVADVVYEIYRTYNYKNGKLVEIPTGPVQILNNNGENYKTDANGEIHITELPLGQYTFKEVSAPEGIQISTKEYVFVLPYTLNEGGERQYAVYVYPKNVQLTGSLSFQKVGDDGKEGLKNVKFEVYGENGSSVKGADGNMLTVTTRLSGQAVIEDLPVGKYYLLETQNPDTAYLISTTTKYWFQIYQENDEIQSRSFYTDASMAKKITDAKGVELAEGTIINYKISSGNSLTKTGDETNLSWYLIALCGAGVVGIGLIYRRNKKKKE